MEEELIHSGVLELKNGKWHRREFNVYPGYLVWAKDDGTEDGRVQLDNQSEVRALKFGLKKKFQFEVETKGKALKLAASGDAERLDWIQALENAAKKASEPHQRSSKRMSKKSANRAKVQSTRVTLMEQHEQKKEAEASMPASEGLESIIGSFDFSTGEKPKPIKPVESKPSEEDSPMDVEMAPEGRLSAAERIQNKLQGHVTFVASAVPPCVVCSKKVYGIEQVVVDGKKMHKTCFRCAQCDTKLSPSNYSDLGGEYYCRVHYLSKIRAQRKQSMAPVAQEAATKSTSTAPSLLKRLSKRLSARRSAKRESAKRESTKRKEEARQQNVQAKPEQDEEDAKSAEQVDEEPGQAKFEQEQAEEQEEEEEEEQEEEEEEEEKEALKRQSARSSKRKSAYHAETDENEEEDLDARRDSHENLDQNRERFSSRQAARRDGTDDEEEEPEEEEQRYYDEDDEEEVEEHEEEEEEEDLEEEEEEKEERFVRNRNSTKRPVLVKEASNLESVPLTHTVLMRPTLQRPRRRLPKSAAQEPTVVKGTNDAKEKLSHPFSFKLDAGKGNLQTLYCSSQSERDVWVSRLANAVHLKKLEEKLRRAQRIDMMSALQAQAELENFRKTADLTYNGYMEKLAAGKKIKWERCYFELQADKLLCTLESKKKKKKKPLETPITAECAVLDLQHKIIKAHV